MPFLSPNQQCQSTEGTIENLHWKYIPTNGRLTKHCKPIPEAVQHRLRIYRKYEDTSHPAHIKAAREACYLVKQARRNFESNLAKKIKEDRKSFFAYVRCTSKSSVKVVSLMNISRQIISEAKEKAKAFNNFFSQQKLWPSPLWISYEFTEWSGVHAKSTIVTAIICLLLCMGNKLKRQSLDVIILLTVYCFSCL